MTGYGLATSEYQNKRITVEIRSLNSKFMELMLKLPKSYSDKESILRNECAKLIERGKVSVAFNIENTSEESVGNTSLNVPLFKTYYLQLKKLAEELNTENANVFHEALSIPEVWNSQLNVVNEDEWKAIYHTFLKSIDAFNSFRLEEGNTLTKDLEFRVSAILIGLSEVEKFENNRVPAIKDKLETLLKDTIGVENIDQNRLEQELIFYVEKFDITEEKIRLKTHCEYFISVMKEKESNGKKLGFIGQEIGREINTLGSKANDASIQKIVVGMKDELEKIKEQLLNIL